MKTFSKVPRVALIAHDAQKDKLIEIAKQFKSTLEQCVLCGTGTTAGRLNYEVGLNVEALLSGPMGGDQQIGAMVAQGDLDAVLFLRDPLCAQPHEPDISALLRVCDLHKVALGTNSTTARWILRAIKEHLDHDEPLRPID